MIKVLFLCHGNICRSIAAQCIFLDMLKKQGKEERFEVDSAALTNEEIGNSIYPPMRAELNRRGVPIARHYARRMTGADLEHFDYIFYMDNENAYHLRYQGLLSEKTKSICIYGNGFDEIEDPWYSGRFSLVCDQLYICLTNFLKSVDK